MNFLVDNTLNVCMRTMSMDATALSGEYSGSLNCPISNVTNLYIEFEVPGMGPASGSVNTGDSPVKISGTSINASHSQKLSIWYFCWYVMWG